MNHYVSEECHKENVHDIAMQLQRMVAKSSTPNHYNAVAEEILCAVEMKIAAALKGVSGKPHAYWDELVKHCAHFNIAPWPVSTMHGFTVGDSVRITGVAGHHTVKGFYRVDGDEYVFVLCGGWYPSSLTRAGDLESELAETQKKYDRTKKAIRAILEAAD